jgi:hypothetical protein
MIPNAVASSIPVSPEVTLKEPTQPYLKILLEASSFSGSAVGVAAVKPETYKAYEQAIAVGKTIRPEIEYLLQNAKPGGRIYAALLLRRIDPVAGKQALESLRSDQTKLLFFSGCSPDETTVSALAVEFLHSNPSF